MSDRQEPDPQGRRRRWLDRGENRRPVPHPGKPFDKPITEVLADELDHKFRQFFAELTAGFAMSAFNYAGEIELLTGVRRDVVLQMGQEVLRIQRHDWQL